jgi:hypothetical protein
LVISKFSKARDTVFLLEGATSFPARSSLPIDIEAGNWDFTSDVETPVI